MYNDPGKDFNDAFVKGAQNFKKRTAGKRFSFNEFFTKLEESMNNSSGKGKIKRVSPIIILLITLVIMFINFFLTLPALNPMAPEFYAFLIMGIIIFAVLNTFFGKLSIFKTLKFSGIGILALIIIPALGSIFSAPFFSAKSYANLIKVEDAEFADTVKTINVSQIPIVDREAAIYIGDKKMGSISELVSQFVIDDNYTQLNVNNKAMRVTPLKYNDLIKYFMNMKNGIQYYVNVNMATQEANLVKLNEPIFYSKSDILMRNINRKIRFQYPFDMLAETNFEIDDEGNPFYVTPVLTKRIKLFGGLDANGVIITNGNTGKSVKYELGNIPEWVDRVFPSELIIEQLNFRGLYRDGFINSVFGQKNVTKTTFGYNYIPMNNDIYLFTGVTSVRSDASNLGFYFVNLRTKESKFFSVPSADEQSAMKTSEGAVQEKNYYATFPILLNINNKPVYLMALKDNTKTAKMYSLVDAANFTNVSTGTTIQEAMLKFDASYSPDNVPGKDAGDRTIKVAMIQSMVIDGNTIFYIKAEGDDTIYVATAKQLGSSIAFVKEGDSLNIYGNPRDKQFDILEIKP